MTKYFNFNNKSLLINNVDECRFRDFEYCEECHLKHVLETGEYCNYRANYYQLRNDGDCPLTDKPIHKEILKYES